LTPIHCPMGLLSQSFQLFFVGLGFQKHLNKVNRCCWWFWNDGIIGQKLFAGVGLRSSRYVSWSPKQMTRPPSQKRNRCLVTGKKSYVPAKKNKKLFFLQGRSKIKVTEKCGHLISCSRGGLKMFESNHEWDLFHWYWESLDCRPKATRWITSSVNSPNKLEILFYYLHFLLHFFCCSFL